MQPMPVQDEDEDFGIPLDQNVDYGTSEEEQAPNLEDDWESRSINMEEYAGSPEDEEATWEDVAKDVVIQPALGLAGAFTWGFDLLKMGMVGEALTDLDELENAFEKAGKPFDRDKYIQTVAEQSQYIPTQELAEELFQKGTGVSLEPKSPTGKKIRKFFTLVGLLRGKGLAKAATGAGVGIGTSEALKAGGVNELAADVIGDVAAGGTTALSKSPRKLSPEVAALEQTAAKHGLPFPEYLTREGKELVSPKISDARKLTLQKEMGMASEEAVENIISGKLPLQKVKKQGYDLEVLADEAYDKVSQLAKANPNKIPTNQIVKDIDSEIARIKSKAPSPSDADKSAIRILEGEKKVLSKAKPTTQELTQQIKNYNSNVSSIYRKAEFAGSEDAARGAYAFMNNSIRNTIEKESGQEVRQAMKAADALYAEKSKLDRVEGLVSNATKNGEYDPKKLQTLLNSKQGLIVRRELGDEAVNEIRDIAKYGDKAQKAVLQLAKSANHVGNITEWGALPGYLLYKMPHKAGLLIGAKAVGDRVRGYLMTRPATRTVYRDIIKNAANGSFKAMPADFKKLEAAISKDYGSVDEFMQTMQQDLKLFNDEED